jgi:hypothetical protein
MITYRFVVFRGYKITKETADIFYKNDKAAAESYIHESNEWSSMQTEYILGYQVMPNHVIEEGKYYTLNSLNNIEVFKNEATERHLSQITMTYDITEPIQTFVGIEIH